MHLSVKDKHHLRVKDWKTIFQENDSRKQAVIVILIMDFNQKSSQKAWKDILILIKDIIYQEFSILNISVPNAKGTTFIKVTLLKLKAHIVPHTIIMGEFEQGTQLAPE